MKQAYINSLIKIAEELCDEREAADDEEQKKKKKKPGSWGPFEEYREKGFIKTLQDDPATYNRRTEMDILPVPATRASLISALGLGLGALYGAGSYVAKEKNPTVAGVIGNTAGYTGLGWGIGSGINAGSHFLGFLAGAATPSRTPEQQAAFDSRYQLVNLLPGADMYNLYKREHLVDENGNLIKPKKKREEE